MFNLEWGVVSLGRTCCFYVELSVFDTGTVIMCWFLFNPVQSNPLNPNHLFINLTISSCFHFPDFFNMDLPFLYYVKVTKDI